eukprot:NODE_3403_length_778_cov_91.803841_g2843_i0.p2 GENE.NODE_3403_length_778_cov_91.803841_g2843_i0~~NODE_3403_length_778_cov_91.803841_g2843_i0.p2  ORF type:complete len:236 (-),score=62.17 NODE_3403_length_778_cov_91.803841_g2843_i0:19-726(-)
MVEEQPAEQMKTVHGQIEQYKQMDASNIDKQYDDMADNYDTYAETLGYPDPDSITEAIERVCSVAKDAKINDFGCGTGLIAEVLAKKGYSHIDGCDASPKMLDLAREKGQMKDVRTIFLCKDQIPDEWKGQYDVVCSAGLMTFDHCDSSVLEEKYSVLKPGGAGIICFTLRPIYMQKFKYEDKINEMIAEGRLEFVEKLTFTRYYKSDVTEAKDERFKPTEVGTFIYRAKWPQAQ